MFQEIDCTSQFYRIMLILGNLHVWIVAIKFAKKTLKCQLPGISTGTNTSELSLFLFLQVQLIS